MPAIQRTSMIDSNATQLNSDYDFSLLRKWILGNKGGVLKASDFLFNKDSGVLSAGSEIAEAIILCKRPTSYPLANQTFLAQFQFSGVVENIPETEGTKIWIEIKENLILDPTLIQDQNGEADFAKGFNIGEIRFGADWPKHSNYLPLYEITSGGVKDKRVLVSIPKVQELQTKVESIEETVNTTSSAVAELKSKGAIDHLSISGIVGEKYTMDDNLFLQKTPTLEDSTIPINVGDVDDNKEIHIQRIASGEANNQLKLKMKKVGEPTTTLTVEVRKGIKVDVSDREAYWYGGEEVLASATIPYTEFNTEWKEHTITLNNEFGGTKGELLNIVVYQQDKITNSSNYYQIACDSTQWSEAFSYVSVNGTSRERDIGMPYCTSLGFGSSLLTKLGGRYFWGDLLREDKFNNNHNSVQEFSLDGHKEGDRYSIELEFVFGSKEFSGTDQHVYFKKYTGSRREDSGFTRIQDQGTTSYVVLRANGEGIKSQKRTAYIVTDKPMFKLEYPEYRSGVYDINFDCKTTIKRLKQELKTKNPNKAPMCMPRRMNNIGEMGLGTTFGMHINGIRITQI